MGILCYLTVILIKYIVSLAHHMKDLLFSYPLSSHAVWKTFSVGVAGEGMEGFHTPESRGENECNTERRTAGKN